MNEKDGTQSSTKQRRSRKTSSDNQQNGKASAAHHPIHDDTEAWKAYWKEQGQPWRTEPEIGTERQAFLAARRSITPDIKQGIYPFKDFKLSRADVEWLLATHENGRGPIDWNDEKSLHERRGLDLRGADLRQINLTGLPLSCLRGSLNQEERKLTTAEQCKLAVVHLEAALLIKTHLERADLFGARLEKAKLYSAYLEKAYLRDAHLEGADLYAVHLKGSHMREAHLKYTDLRRAQLERAELVNVSLSDEKQIGPRVVDANWSDVNLSVIKWSQVSQLGDEYQARLKKLRKGEPDSDLRLGEYEQAARANHQLAVTLQAQGLNDVGARFAYRSQLLQRKVFWYQRKFGQYLFSLFLDLLAGYGYKPWRSFVGYLLVIAAFATAYFIIGQTVGPALSPLGSFVFSMTSFHGRGFFPGGIGLDDPLTVLAALEAFVGLLIEVTFIATLTQRLFGK